MARGVQEDVRLDVPPAGFAGRLEVLAGPSGRAKRSVALKARIVAESFAPGITVAEVARRHGTTRWQVYHWRKLAKRGLLGEVSGVLEAPPAFAAVVVEEAPAPPPVASGPAGLIELVVGDVVIRAPRDAEVEHLARTIRAARLAAP
jgi:transposase